MRVASVDAVRQLCPGRGAFGGVLKRIARLRRRIFRVDGGVFGVA